VSFAFEWLNEILTMIMAGLGALELNCMLQLDLYARTISGFVNQNVQLDAFFFPCCIAHPCNVDIEPALDSK